MDGTLYADPLKQLFPFSNFAQPLTAMMKDKSNQEKQAMRVIQEWQADGKLSAGAASTALQTRAGTDWERAMTEAAMRTDQEVSNPWDFMSLMLGPAWYLTTPYYALTGQKEKIGELPMTKTGRAADTVTDDTAMEPIGNVLGLFAKPETWIRQKAGMPEYGEYGDYYVDRQLAAMVAEGLVTPDEAQRAMIERQGEVFEQAKYRVDQELAMRVPGASALYAAGHDPKSLPGAIPASLFGAQVLSDGEMKYRGLYDTWTDALRRADAGDDTAMRQFFDDHPEYEANLQKNRPPEERLRSYLTGMIWDKYMELDKANKRLARGQMGSQFNYAFLNEETRDPEGVDVQTLATWARFLGGMAPQTPEMQPINAIPDAQFPALEPMRQGPDMAYNVYQQQKAQQFPNIDALQTMYFDQSDAAAKRRFLKVNPQLAEYWDWRRQYINQNPEAAPFIDSTLAKNILSGKVDADEQTKRLLGYWNIDYATPLYTADYYLQDASPILVNALQYYALTGQKPGVGSMRELGMIWDEAGKPGETLANFMDKIIVPTMR
jgi:hypothetical protein